MTSQENRFAKHALIASPQVGYAYRTRVRFQEVDAAGIVFFARIFEYFHEAYFAYLTASGIDLPQATTEAPWVAPIKHAEADYLRPLRFGDELVIELVQSEIEGSVATVGFRLRVLGHVAAVGHSVQVFVDRQSFERITIPEPCERALRHLSTP